MDGADDAQQLHVLLTRIADADPKALRQLYGRTSSKLYGIIVRIVRNGLDADEVLQDVYVTVWRRADQFITNRGSAIAWLSAIARNRAIDLVRARPAASIAVTDFDFGSIADGGVSALEQLQFSDECREIQRCLDQLDPMVAWAIRTAFLAGAPYGELARIRGVPLGTMKSSIRRGLQQLRQLLEADDEARRVGTLRASRPPAAAAR